MSTYVRRSVILSTLVATVTASALLAGPVAAQESVGQPVTVEGVAPDLTIVGNARSLSVAEIRQFDVTNGAAGQAELAKIRARGDGINVNSGTFRVLDFGAQKMVVGAATPVQVRTGVNAAGETVYELIPSAQPAEVAARSGYSVPPSSAWAYNNSSSYQIAVGTWLREIWWTITKANDWKSCSTCTVYDYWRIHGKMRASAVTGAKSNEGFKRAWIEFDRKNTGWSTPTSFEPASPGESYAGVANQTRTVGFGSSFTVNIGVPPLTASGGTETTYGGSMTASSENWHPVIRTEIGSGGVQWCRYQTEEFTGTKLVSTRVSARISSTGSSSGWDILTGQQDYTSSCPSQM